MTVVQCAVIKGDSPITISWFFNGVEITPGYQGVLIGKMSQRISTLSIEAVRARHSGDYTCRASNAAGKTDHTAYLNVNGNTPFSMCIQELPFYSFGFFKQDKIILYLIKMLNLDN
jgi:hypothetical protein